MQRSLWFAGVLCMILLLIPSRLFANDHACIDPLTLTDRVVQVHRHLTGEKGGAMIVQGSAWVAEDQEMRGLITNEHVSTNLRLSVVDWNDLFISHRTLSRYTSVRYTKTYIAAQHRSSDLSLLQVTSGIADIQALKMATAPPNPGEQVFLIGYPQAKLRVGVAHVYRGSSGILEYIVSPNHDAFIGLDVEGVTNRGAFEGGSSGSPIVNCSGEVVGVMSRIFPELKQTYPKLEYVSYPPPGRSPNAFGVKVETIPWLFTQFRKRLSQ